jgi:hypothetical protein
MSNEAAVSGDALDLLEHEDIELQQIFHQLGSLSGESVQERADYGELVKATIRRLATREAAITEVTAVATGAPQLADVASRLESDAAIRRPMISQVEKMSRGVQPLSLNQGQDFDGELNKLVGQVEAEIEWELRDALPTMKTVIRNTDSTDDLKSAEHVASHAPTNIHPNGPKWYERAPVISRVISIYDRMRDYPQVASGRK